MGKNPQIPTSLSDLVYASVHHEEHRIKDEELIRLEPFGVSLTQDPNRPTLLLKDQSGQHVLPVLLTPMEAGLTIQHSNKSLPPTSPHRAAERLLDTLNIKIERCVFVEIKNRLQYVRLFMENHPTHGSIKLRADECMSLCLHLGVSIYATAAFMAKSKIMNVEVEETKRALMLNPGAFVKHHQYIQ